MKYCTAADLIEQLYRGLADNSDGRIIDGLICNDLIIIGLCRHRDYTGGTVRGL